MGVDSGAQVDGCLASEGSDDSGDVALHGDIDQVWTYNRLPCSTVLVDPVVLEQDLATGFNEASEGGAGQVETLLVSAVPVMHYQHLRGRKKECFLVHSWSIVNFLFLF